MQPRFLQFLLSKSSKIEVFAFADLSQQAVGRGVFSATKETQKILRIFVSWW